MRNTEELLWTLATPLLDKYGEEELVDEVEIGHIAEDLERLQVRDFLAGAGKLRKLQLRLPYSPWESTRPDLIYLLDEAHWPSLETFHLGGAEFTPKFLSDFLCLHQSTLKDVHLERVHIMQGKWPTFFKAIGAKLPKLESFTLLGSFTEGQNHIFQAFAHPEWRKADDYATKLEYWLVHGGEEFPRPPDHYSMLRDLHYKLLDNF